jgi:hypothetical protein
MTANLNTPARSYWVIFGKLLAGAFPSHPEAVIARKRLREFLDVGITSFLSLMRNGEKAMHGIPKDDYEPFLRETAAAMGLHVTFTRFGIPDGCLSSKQKLMRILDYIDDLLNKGRKIYLHCWSGCGRTGLIVGCWLVRHGMTGDEALKRITLLRQDDKYLCEWSSPATMAQCDMVRQWQSLERSRA